MKISAYQPANFSKINEPDSGKIGAISFTEKSAVFFTDIVGSTEFFKLYGDEHGKKMLHNHYNVASSIINRFNGRIIKFIGDSIMAYFKNPFNALKAAINLQQKVQTQNKQSQALPVRIRIGIHYGNVLFEKDDIYGDVVNVASKLTDIAEGDKIYISNELYNQVKDAPFVHFEMIEGTAKKNIPDEFIVYSVSWDEELILDKENIVFFISPIPLPENSPFYNFWKNFIHYDDIFLKDKIKKVNISKNDALVFYLKDHSWMFDIAKYIIDSFKKDVKIIKDTGIVPVYFLIDNTNDIKKDVELFEEHKNYISPGYIHISEDAFVATGNIDIALVEKPPIISCSKKIYRLFYPAGKKMEIEPFYFGYILTEGPYRPCFYCGSKQHKPINCPTKNLPETTGATNKIGYVPIDRINRLFFNLTKEFKNSEIIITNSEDEQKFAYEAFFEPTRVFQLRFLRTIWNCSEIDWAKAKNTISENEGGLVWLAQDSLRICDYENVEACLKKAIENTPNNFRIYCIYGLLSIEKEDMENAEVYLKKAIKYAKNRIQKDYLNLLLARLYYEENRLNDAWKVINDLIFQDPLCLDAHYLSIKIDLKMEKHSKAMVSLMDLIHDDRDYFIYAYMDCELFPYRELITETLEKIFKKVKENAMELSGEAEKEFIDSKDFMDTHTVSDLEGISVKIKQLIEQNSFFGYLDAIHLSHIVKSQIHNNLKEKREGLKIKLKKISQRIEKGLKKIQSVKYKRLAHEYKTLLEKFSEEINRASKNILKASFGELTNIGALYRNIDEELTKIEEKLENLLFLDKVLISINTFTTYIIFSLTIVFIMATIIIPSVAYYLNTVFLKLGFTTPLEEMDYKRYTFLWGGILGFILSIYASVRKFLKYPFFH